MARKSRAKSRRKPPIPRKVTVKVNRCIRAWKALGIQHGRPFEIKSGVSHIFVALMKRNKKTLDQVLDEVYMELLQNIQCLSDENLTLQ